VLVRGLPAQDVVREEVDGQCDEEGDHQSLEKEVPGFGEEEEEGRVHEEQRVGRSGVEVEIAVVAEAET